MATPVHTGNLSDDELREAEEPSPQGSYAFRLQHDPKAVNCMTDLPVGKTTMRQLKSRSDIERIVNLCYARIEAFLQTLHREQICRPYLNWKVEFVPKPLQIMTQKPARAAPRDWTQYFHIRLTASGKRSSYKGLRSGRLGGLPVLEEPLDVICLTRAETESSEKSGSVKATSGTASGVARRALFEDRWINAIAVDDSEAAAPSRWRLSLARDSTSRRSAAFFMCPRLPPERSHEWSAFSAPLRRPIPEKTSASFAKTSRIGVEFRVEE